MNFDPEKVERWTYFYDLSDRAIELYGSTPHNTEIKDDDVLVRASDYDQLLSLYREAKIEIAKWEHEARVAE